MASLWQPVIITHVCWHYSRGQTAHEADHSRLTKRGCFTTKGLPCRVQKTIGNSLIAIGSSGARPLAAQIDLCPRAHCSTVGHTWGLCVSGSLQPPSCFIIHRARLKMQYLWSELTLGPTTAAPNTPMTQRSGCRKNVIRPV